MNNTNKTAPLYRFATLMTVAEKGQPIQFFKLVTLAKTPDDAKAMADATELRYLGQLDVNNNIVIP